MSSGKTHLAVGVAVGLTVALADQRKHEISHHPGTGVVLGGLAFTPNNESLPIFCWGTLVELPLSFTSRYECSTPHQNVYFQKFHHMPKRYFF